MARRFISVQRMDCAAQLNGMMGPTFPNSLAGKTKCVKKKVMIILLMALESMAVGGRRRPCFLVTKLVPILYGSTSNN